MVSSFTLKLRNDIVNDATVVSNAFNDLFSTVADHIGTVNELREGEATDDILKAYDDHESIIKIKSHIQNGGSFSFQDASQDHVKHNIT